MTGRDIRKQLMPENHELCRQCLGAIVECDADGIKEGFCIMRHKLIYISSRPDAYTPIVVCSEFMKDWEDEDA
jgi:hypothetical protein